MRKLRNERGVALVMSLMLTLIGLAVCMLVLYMITESMQLSASSRRYKTALEASYGGVETFTKQVIPWYVSASTQGTSAARSQLQTSIANLGPAFAGRVPTFASYSCMTQKLTLPAAQWNACRSTTPNSTPTSVDPTGSPDVVFKLRGPPLQPNFNVFTKIVATQPGNSDMSGTSGLDTGGGVAYGTAGISPVHIPATYRIEAQAQRETNPQEKASLSVLYAY